MQPSVLSPEVEAPCRISLLIAEDHSLVAAGITRLLEPEFNVLVCVTDGRAAVAAALEHKPDVIVLDITLPLLNGIEAARQIRREAPDSKIIFVTVHDSPEYVQQAFDLGAFGYVLKQAAASELSTAIRQVAAGNYYIPPQLEQRINRGSFDPTVNPVGLFRRLTRRQREVLQLVAEGKAAKEIAFLLEISTKTVEFHKNCIMNELGVRTTAQLVRYAVSEGLVAN